MIEKKLKAHIYHLICKEIAGFRRPKMQKQQKHGKREKKKERERERRRRRRRRRRRNGDASSISDYISPWLRSFNNGGKYQKKKKKKKTDLVEPLRTSSSFKTMIYGCLGYVQWSRWVGFWGSSVTVFVFCTPTLGKIFLV